MHRLFVAIRPPEDVRDLLIDAMDDSPALRWVGDEQLHLTLRFIGEVERPVANDIAAALDPRSLAALRSARHRRRQIREAERRRPLGGRRAEGAGRALAAKVERALHRSGSSPSTAHSRRTSPWRAGTAATRKRSTPSCGGTPNLQSEPFQVDRFILFESQLSRHGPHYEEVAAFPLRLISRASARILALFPLNRARLRREPFKSGAHCWQPTVISPYRNSEFCTYGRAGWRAPRPIPASISWTPSTSRHIGWARRPQRSGRIRGRSASSRRCPAARTRTATRSATATRQRLRRS